MTAAKRRGLNSVFRHRRAICFKSRRTPRSAVRGVVESMAGRRIKVDVRQR